MQINNKIILLLAILLVSPLIVSGALTDGLVSYFSFENNALDNLSRNNGTIQGAVVYNSSCKIGGCYGFNAGTSTINLSNSPSLATLTGDFSFSFWLLSNASSPNGYLLSKQSASYVAQPFTIYVDSNEKLYLYNGDGTNQPSVTSDNGFAYNKWVYIVVTKNGSVVTFYYNGTQSGTTETLSAVTPTNSNLPFHITNAGNNGAGFYGYMDELAIYNRTLTSVEVSQLWNNGTGLSPINDTTPSILNLTFSARNIYNSTFYINNYTIEFNNNGSLYSTTNGTIYLNNYNISNLLNISFTNATNHFNINYSNLNLSSGSYVIVATNILNMTDLTITSPTSQNYAYNQNININWTAPNSYINTSISSYNISLLNSDLSFNKTINASNTGLYQVLNLSIIDSGSYYIKIVAKDIYNLTNENTSDVFNITSILGIKLQNNYTLNYEDTFSGYVILSDGENRSFTGSSGSATLNIYPGLNQIYIEKSGYSITSANYFNFTLSSTAQTYNKTFQLYTNNSVYIMIKDETTFNLITENISVELTLGNITIDTYYTTNGTLFLDNLSDGEYNIDIGGVSSNYTSRNYVISVAEHSTQTLTAFLSSSLSAVIFVVLDSYSSAILEDATISLYKYINGSLSLIEIKNSDITGRAQFNYIPLSKYRIIVQKTGYISKSFDLDPILFASYDIFLDRNIAYTYTGSLEDVKIIFSPSQYYANETTNFLFIISSSTGVLNSYGVNLSYPCGNKSFTGNNSIGELYNTSFMISCAKFGDQVNMTYFYKSVGNPTRYYLYQYYIGGTYSASNYTFINLRNQGETFGLGALERIIIVTFLGLIVAGVTYLMIGGVGAVILCLLVFSYFTYTGFIPLWSVLISMVAGVFLLIGRDN